MANLNKTDNTNRKPNAPTQGGFSNPGAGTGGNPNQQRPNQQQPHRPNQSSWGKDSINKDRNTDRR
ncbi:MAG: hypothetical protein K0R24_1085 [Gammaproteobacteria bacterium]|nr:hypothetical protein [Gammaproteobacteria bacterium]